MRQAHGFVSTIIASIYSKLKPRNNHHSPLPHPNVSLDNWKENNSVLHDGHYWTTGPGSCFRPLNPSLGRTVSPKRKYTLLLSQVLKTEGGGGRWKVGDAPNPPLSWSKLGQLNGGCGTPPTFPLAPLDCEYLALLQVYFRRRLYWAFGWVGMSSTLSLGQPSPEPWSLFLK